MLAWRTQEGDYEPQSGVRNHRTAERPGARPRSRHTGTAPGSRFPRAGGRNAVEVMTSYLNLSDQVTTLRTTLANLASPDTRTDEPGLGQS